MQERQDARLGALRKTLVHEDDGISARDVVEAAPDAMVLLNEAGKIVLANEPAEQLFRYSLEDLLGQPVEMLVPGLRRFAQLRPRPGYAAEQRHQPLAAEPDLLGVRKDGTGFPVDIRLSPLASHHGMLVIFAMRDVLARRRAEFERHRLANERALYARLSRLARQDPLTGLPNRMLLYDRLSTAIACANRNAVKLGVLFLDVDHFKHVNDSLGHAAGDSLLRSLADRLQACVRRSDTVSRQGGDEFVILLTEVKHREDLEKTAAKIAAAIRAMHHVGSADVHITASLGIAVFPEDGEDAETLIGHADIAMYHAKDDGRDRWHFFTPDMSAPLLERQAVESSLRRALQRHEFLLHYQPRINLATGHVVAGEALIRWQHPDRGIVRPGSFIRVAEENGLIVPIGQWVLREACRQARAWQASVPRPVPVAVNVSGRELRERGFLDGLGRALDETGLDPRLLELEVTESVLMESEPSTAEVLWETNDMGLRLTVDDFGTGLSSLAYLTHFPVDALKMDQSFVRDVGAEDDESPVVTAVIAMGRSLKQRVIAEGVETEEQLAFLQAQRCEEGQGFHFGRPMPGDQFASLLSVSSGPVAGRGRGTPRRARLERH